MRWPRPILPGSLVLLELALLVLGTACAPRAKLQVWRPAEHDLGSLRKLAILDFSGPEGKKVGAAVAARFATHPRYSLASPEEQDRIQSSLANSDGEPDLTTARDAARQLGVDAILTGQVVRLQLADDAGRTPAEPVGGADLIDPGSLLGAWGPTFNSSSTARQPTLTLTVKLLDVHSGELRSARQTSHKYHGPTTKNGAGVDHEPMLQSLIAACARDIEAELAPHLAREEVVLARQYFGNGLTALRRGNQLAVAGNWAEAEQAWREARKRNPRNHAALFNLSLAAAARQDYPQAIKLSTDAIAAFPSTLYHDGLARLRLEQTQALLATPPGAPQNGTELARLPPTSSEDATVKPASYSAPALKENVAENTSVTLPSAAATPLPVAPRQGISTRSPTGPLPIANSPGSALPLPTPQGPLPVKAAVVLPIK